MSAPAAIDPTELFSADQLDRAHRFAMERTRAWIAALAVLVVWLAVASFRPMAGWLTGAGDAARGQGSIFRATAVAAGGASLLMLPFGLRRYRAGARVGIERRTVARWLRDMFLRGLATLLLLWSVLVGLLQAAAAGNWVVFSYSVAGAMIGVALNAFWPAHPGRRFRALADPWANAELRRLSQVAGLRQPAALVRPVGRKTSLENASVRGVRPTTMILHDTLYEHSDPQRITTVIAHELGHIRDHDPLTFAFDLPVLGVGLGLGLVRLMRTAMVLSLTGSVRPGAACEVPLLLLLFVVLALVCLVAELPYRRSRERAADRFGLRLTGDLEGFERIQINLATRGLRDQYPTRLQTMFATHPTATERIAAARRYVQEALDGQPPSQGSGATNSTPPGDSGGSGPP